MSPDASALLEAADIVAREIRVRGRVQGIGFRPAIWRLAREMGLVGEVRNDADGVVIIACGDAAAVERFIARLGEEAPPRARIDQIVTRPIVWPALTGFRIESSRAGQVLTEIAPDMAICADCAREIRDPFQRRFRYALTNCTHCGPRLSIIHRVPYDRDATTMAPFTLCGDCAGDYADPADRRFHAEATACHVCGPKPRLVRIGGGTTSFDQHSMLDDVDAAGSLIQKGFIVAFKGIGGYQLACDARNHATVQRLRQAKARETKPFALMARHIDVIRRYCSVGSEEGRQLASAEGPIVLLRADGAERLPDSVAPGLNLLGFMLPTTPMHVLALMRLNHPVVMTSANISDEPQITDDAEALERLVGIADYALVHDRAIAVRVDDSVLRVIGDRPRLIRRARGYAPSPIALPEGFADAPTVLACGGELKATFCLLADGKATLSQHIGDLGNAATFDDFRANLALYTALFDHAPAVLAADSHPDYRSARLARGRAAAEGLPLIEVGHHHAHIAACLAENGRSIDAPPVLGIALDGIGWGADGTAWGGEFLLVDYRNCARLAALKPVAMPGGDRAAREPWRNLYAQIAASMGWDVFRAQFGALDLYRTLETKPRATIEAMIRGNFNAPLGSSCGRLFDAVAAALGLCADRQGHEAEAASRLEAIVCETTLRDEADARAYPFAMAQLASGLPMLDPASMWRALFADLAEKISASVIAARFHKGLAIAVAAMATQLAAKHKFDTVALSGGCFQNAILHQEIATRLATGGFTVLTHEHVPANDGGIAFGQAAVAAARFIAGQE